MRPIIAIAIFSMLPVLAAEDLHLTDTDLFSKLHGQRAGTQVSLTGIELDSIEVMADLEAFTVFHPNSKVVVQNGGSSYELAMPNNTYYRGWLRDRDHGRVVLSVLADGTMRGFIMEAGKFWMLGGGERSGGPLTGMMVVEVDERTTRDMLPKTCDSDLLAPPPVASAQEVRPLRAAAVPMRGSSYQATIAFETDFEYYQQFGNTTDATDYIGDLVAYSSTLYQSEVSTSLLVGDVFLNTSSGDVWQESNVGCILYEFGRYWNDNRTGVERTAAHFLSGKGSGGVAWVGVLCRGGFNYDTTGAGCSFSGTDNFGGDYGVSGGIDGNFDIGSPTIVNDLLIFAHEVGHNFDSTHTHCYAGIGGNANDVDQCYGSQNGCYSGPTSLPSGCPGSGNGCGTVMSYCHLLSGGNSNISFTFGQGHPYGIEPDRVPAEMAAHVVQQDILNKGCLTGTNTGEEWYALVVEWPTTDVLVLVQNVHLAP